MLLGGSVKLRIISIFLMVLRERITVAQIVEEKGIDNEDRL